MHGMYVQAVCIGRLLTAILVGIRGKYDAYSMMNKMRVCFPAIVVVARMKTNI